MMMTCLIGLGVAEASTSLWEPPLELWMSFSAVSPFVVKSKHADDTRNVVHCKSWNLILQFALRRGGCPTKSCVRRYAAGSNFSLAMGSASRKVCIGVLP